MGVCQLGRAFSSVERGDRCSPIHKRTRDETASCARRQAATLAENCSGTAPRSRPSRQSAGAGRPAPWVGAAHSAQRSWAGNPSRTVWHQSLLLPGCGRASDRCQPLDAPPPICDASACSASAQEHFLTNVVGLTANTWNWILPAADSFATGLRKAHASRSSCICTPSFPMHSIKLLLIRADRRYTLSEDRRYTLSEALPLFPSSPPSPPAPPAPPAPPSSRRWP
eukprot:COSAG01_NODE_2936_length_6828_cov_20.818992_1_plen_225_part_00